jgi:hypothetical protein
MDRLPEDDDDEEDEDEPEDDEDELEDEELDELEDDDALPEEFEPPQAVSRISPLLNSKYLTKFTMRTDAPAFYCCKEMVVRRYC